MFDDKGSILLTHMIGRASLRHTLVGVAQRESSAAKELSPSEKERERESLDLARERTP